MIKIVEMVCAKPGVSRQYFHDHWRHPHSTWGLLIKCIRGLIQGHRFDTPHLPATQSRFEGVAAIFVEGVNDTRAWHEDPSYKKYMAQDAALFVDRDNMVAVFTTEEVLQSAPSVIEEEGSADFAWRWERRPVSVKLIQMIEEEGERPWASDNDLMLGRSIGAARHIRSYPHPEIHAEGSPALGFRELWWPTYTDFETGIGRDPQALEQFLSRPAKSYVGLYNDERFPH